MPGAGSGPHGAHGTGTADGYVAEMKGVLLTHAPGIAVIDVSHDVAAHDVEGARLAVARYWRRFPRGTVHVAVVDPGVGSGRAALAVELFRSTVVCRGDQPMPPRELIPLSAPKPV